MASKRLSALQSGLEAASGKQRSAAPPAAAPAPAGAKAKTPREGQIHLGAWVSSDFKKSMLLAQVKTGRKTHELIREAYNDLFAKYDVPVING